MKRLTILGLALLALLAFGAVSAGVASAEPGLLKLKTFTTEVEEGSKPVIEFSNTEKIQCAAVAILEATLTTDTHGSGVLHFTKCKAENLVPANTLGDASEIILMQVLFLICLITPKTLVWGLFLEPTATVHSEVPAVGQLLLLKGAIIFENKSGNGLLKQFLFVAAGKEGKQTSATRCFTGEKEGKLEGEKKYSFEAGKDTETDKAASYSALLNIKFTENVELMDT